MPDKKYQELLNRLEKNKKNSVNFRSYERMRQDARVKRQRDRENTEAEPPRPSKKPDKRAQDTYALLQRLSKAVIPALIAVAVVILGIYAFTYKNATEVSVNGEAVGQLKTVGVTKEDFVSTLEMKIEQLEDTKIKFLDEITLTPVHGSKKELKDDSQMLNLMAEIVAYQVLAAEISVDGQAIGIAKNQTEAKAIFDWIQAPFITDPENTKAEFVEDVKATDVYVDKSEITPSDTIRAELSKTTTANIEYTVESGDTLSKIAALNGMTMSELKELNPGLDPAKTLNIGDKINLVSTLPAVSVITTETKTETAEIPMDVVPQPDSSLAPGQKKIIQQGKPGKKEVVTQIVKVNGVVTSTDIISEKILEPAVSQVVTVGG